MNVFPGKAKASSPPKAQRTNPTNPAGQTKGWAKPKPTPRAPARTMTPMMGGKMPPKTMPKGTNMGAKMSARAR